MLYSELVKHFVPAKTLGLEFVVLTKTKRPGIETYTVAIDQQRVDRSRKTVERDSKINDRIHSQRNRHNLPAGHDDRPQ